MFEWIFRQSEERDNDKESLYEKIPAEIIVLAFGLYIFFTVLGVLTIVTYMK